MAAAEEVQALLRFLTKDARLPLTEAMPKIHALRKLELSSPDKIAKADQADLKIIFTDEKSLKQVANAAKRVSNPKKRASVPSRKSIIPGDAEQDQETALALPTCPRSEEDLDPIVIETNRAPLFLAFTFSVLKYTHPEQPVSSRLSLAQAVVSAGAQSRAKYLGITSGTTAEEDGWAQGQPKIRIMGREVAVMRRQTVAPPIEDNTEEIVKAQADKHTAHEAFWGLDLEALRKSNGPLIAGKSMGGHSGPPIHMPMGARNYMLKSMNVVEAADDDDQSQKSPKQKKLSAGAVVARKEEAATLVLKAIDIVCESWAGALTADELDRRAQNWYVLVRPEVAQGQAGWGQRGQLHLRDILKLRRN